MCRWIAYKGVSIPLEELVSKPSNSLLAQSIHAREAKVETNGDGFGVGWYGERAEPGVYRDILPAWNDENLLSLSRQISSPLFFSHVRASTGTATGRSNCHPFAEGRWMFMHNGQVGDYCALRRPLEALIPDDLYARRLGTTDSEALFLAAFAFGLEEDPFGAICKLLERVLDLMEEVNSKKPLRFTAALSEGENVYAFRFASDDRAPSLYYREEQDSLKVVSEPLDDGPAHQWLPAPPAHAIIGNRNGVTEIKPLRLTGRAAK